jgi:hypothetical protein
MLHPQFFKMVEYVCERGAQLKIETNGHYLSVDNCQRMKALGVKAVQVSLDGASAATFNRMRVRGQFRHRGRWDCATSAMRASPSKSTSRRRISTPNEIGAVVDLAYELGAYSFYTGRTMFTGNAVKAWRHLELSDERYERSSTSCAKETEEYRGRMRVYFHEAGLLEELRYRLQHPAALLIVLPNGLVKLINALPFVCGDFRRDSLPEIWANFKRAWHDPRVAQFVDDLAVDPGKTEDAAPMGLSLTTASADRRPRRRGRCCIGLLTVCSMVRYRFLSLCRSAAVPARRGVGLRHRWRLRQPVFWSGLGGVVLRGHRRRGVQRVFRFAHGDRPRVQSRQTCRRCPTACSGSGIVAFAGALAGRCLLTVRGGWPILAFALLGRHSSDLLRGTTRFAGLTEVLASSVIALSYGPWMVLGSLYLHTKGVVVGCAGRVAGARIPDHGPCRRSTRYPTSIRIGWSASATCRATRPQARGLPFTSHWQRAGLLVIPIGVIAGLFPIACLAALLALPLLVASGRSALRTYETPREFVPAVRSIVACYMVAVLLFTGGIVLHALRPILE